MTQIPTPSGWQRTKVGLISNIKYGLGVPPKQLENGTPMLRATNVKRGRIATEGLMRIDASAIPSGKDAVLREGDIIVVRSGAYTGDSALVTGEWAGSIAGYDLVVSPHQSVVPAFLAFWMLGEGAHSHFRGHRERSAQPHLNRQQIGEAVIDLPALAEQQQIARVLSAVQRAIEQQERLIALTAELKKALMHKLFTEGSRGERLKQTEIGPVPESWRTEPLDQHLSAAQYGLSVKGSDDGKTLILRMTNQVDGRVVANDVQTVNIGDDDRRKFKVEPLDILFNRTNSFELVGRTAIFDLPGEYVFASYLIRLRTCPDTLRARFLNHYLNWGATQARLKGIASRAVSQSNISASRLRGFVVPLPSPEEQDQIIRCIDEVDHVRSLRLRRLAVFEGLFRTLVDQLMTAQIRIHDLDLNALDEPAVESVGVA